MSNPLNYISKNKRRSLKACGLVLFIITIVSACVTVYETIENKNFADQYNPNERQMHPEYSIYMKSVDDVRLYFRFFPRELAYFPSYIDSIPRARVSLFYRITSSYSGVQIIDSLTSNFTLRGKPRPHFMGYIPLNITEEGKYIIEVFLTDKNVNQSVSEVIEYNYSKTGNLNSFMLLSQFGNPLFYNHISVNDTFRIRTEMFASKKLQISYYKPDTDLPRPPDYEEPFKLDTKPVDSSWMVLNPDTMLFNFSKEGIYFFSNYDRLNGKSIACYNIHYPYVKAASELLKPLAYITTAKEMNKLKSLKTEKQAVDTFWMKLTNDLDKSRELIRVYYNRVQLANYYFTDYKEGWLTDRGMIYLICGSPAVIRKTDDGEYWIYGRDSKESTQLFFYREEHPIFGKIYVLDRSELYSRMWFNAISTWRDGQVFSLNP